ncbi:hypothetical protein E4U55_003350 [Claviceps digitariae]|nr:hypothetical protein E4U55_003350 [Claviceps digitariae]
MNIGPALSDDLPPMLLPPRTPSELIQDLLSYAPDSSPTPTTVIIAWPKEQFLAALTQDVRQQEQHHDQHPLVRNPSLAQIASARHITMVFVPTVRHLRAYMASWTPPHAARFAQPPFLVVYGFVDLHRHDSMDWSAQGLSISASVVVQGAWRSRLRAVMLEPRTREGQEEDEGGMDGLVELLAEKVSVYSGLPGREDEAHAPWTPPPVQIARALGGWFTVARGLADAV